MNLYTGYFAKLKYYDKSIIPISIAQTSPPFFTGLHYKTLAPSKKLLYAYRNNELIIPEYTKIFMQHLETLSPKKVFNEIAKLTYNSENVILLCWERSDKFCHRFLVAKWLSQKLDILVTER